jgi:hypothetical protein
LLALHEPCNNLTGPGKGDIVPFARQGAPQWRNWQTRYVQGVVGVLPWGFKSLLRHQK